jgi:hypothetical protein
MESSLSKAVTLNGASENDEEQISRHIPIHQDAEKQSTNDLGEESHDEAEGSASSDGDVDDDADNGDNDTAPGGLSRVISRVLSRTSVKSAAPSPPPDGGLAAWTAGMNPHSPYLQVTITNSTKWPAPTSLS